MKIKTDKEGILKDGDLQPGSKVSTDQYTSSLLGRRTHTRGKEPDREKFVGGTIYYDHATQFIYNINQVSLNANETIKGKREFERELAQYGRKVKQYRGDNGIYRSKEFLDELSIRDQTIEFCGVGAHHQNGVAERAIQTISYSARTMMLFAAMHWPDEAKLDLWPLAIDYSIYVWNRMPNRTSGLSPIELITNEKSDHMNLLSTHVWGCPCFVLDPRL